MLVSGGEVLGLKERNRFLSFLGQTRRLPLLLAGLAGGGELGPVRGGQAQWLSPRAGTLLPLLGTSSEGECLLI